MRQELSVLLPSYNDECVELVSQLATECASINGLQFEIIVGDDGSTDTNVVNTNKQINNIPNCRFILNNKNIGRAAIRNRLAQQSKYNWLLFIDSDMSVISHDFIHKYLCAEGQVVYGGYKVIGDSKDYAGNLRFLYEKKAEPALTYEQRCQHPFADFHTSNFLIAKSIFSSMPLDCRFTQYGYEDVLYGRTLKENGIMINHIDNPLGFSRFEDNSHFVRKSEEGLRTLHTFRNELEGYSRLLSIVEKTNQYHLSPLIRFVYNRQKKNWYNNLCSTKPSLFLFKLYKLGYYLSLIP